jgi:hypothetical protein
MQNNTHSHLPLNRVIQEEGEILYEEPFRFSGLTAVDFRDAYIPSKLPLVVLETRAGVIYHE